MNTHRFYKGRALDRELRVLYEEKGKLPDMTKLEHEYHRRTTRILLGVVLFLAALTAASWAGFFLYGPRQGAAGEIKLTFDGPEAVVAGVPQTLKLKYKNLDRAPLALATLAVRLPAGVRLQKASPSSDGNELQWNLGTLAPRSTDEITLIVVPYGQRDETLEVRALFTYKPANFNAEFQVSAIHTFGIRAGPVALTLSGDTQAASGKDLTLTISYENQTDETLKEVEATVEIPSAFIIRDEANRESVWNKKIGTLSPGQKGTLTLTGTLASTASGPLKFVAKLEQVLDKLRYTLEESIHLLEIETGKIRAELLLNGLADARWARLGSTLTFTVRIVNQEPTPLEKVVLTLALRSPLLNWSEIKGGMLSGQGDQRLIRIPETGTITIEAGTTVDQLVTVPLLTNASPTLSTLVEAEAELTRDQEHLKTNALKVFVVSDLALLSEARYFGANGTTALGSEPLPPKVGEETAYEIQLRLHNTFHDLSKVVVTATLPERVRLVNPGIVGSGRLTFNDASREIRWEIPRLSVTTPETTATFMIAARPAESDKGQLLALLGIARVEALDTITQVVFSTDAPSLSSHLDKDPSVKSQGVVE